MNEEAAVVKSQPRTTVTFLGGPLSGRTEIMVGKLPEQMICEPCGHTQGRLFYLPGEGWKEWFLCARPSTVVYRLEGLDCYRAVEP